MDDKNTQNQIIDLNVKSNRDVKTNKIIEDFSKQI